MSFAAIASAIRFTPADRSGDATQAVAKVLEARGDDKVRPAQTLGWQSLHHGMAVYDGDAVFVPPGADATLRFADETVLYIDERSLVVIDLPRAGDQSITLRQGAITGKVGRSDLILKSPAGEAHLAAESEASVLLSERQLEVEVSRGRANISTPQGAVKTLMPGQRARVDDRSIADLPSWPVQLVAPTAHFRQTLQKPHPPIVFEWSGQIPVGARLQIAHDRFFAFVDRELSATPKTAVLANPAAGVTWWRIVDSRGQSISEARRFSLIEHVAPQNMIPRMGEVVLAPLGTSVLFGWTPIAGVARYRLEFSPSPQFETISKTENAASAELRSIVNLAEGIWYWRVRADEEASGLGPPSQAFHFRLIHRQIPKAPELYSPEIEVSP